MGKYYGKLNARIQGTMGKYYGNLSARIQGTMARLKGEHVITYRKGVRDLLAECLSHVNHLETELARYQAGDKYFKNNKLQMKHRDLIRNLAWKIRNQRQAIKDLKLEVNRARHQSATALMMWNRIKRDTTARDVLYEKVKYSARGGDTLRILALLEDWEAKK